MPIAHNNSVLSRRYLYHNPNVTAQFPSACYSARSSSSFVNGLNLSDFANNINTHSGLTDFRQNFSRPKNGFEMENKPIFIDLPELTQSILHQ
jgi:hypothetical protein